MAKGVRKLQFVPLVGVQIIKLPGDLFINIHKRLQCTYFQTQQQEKDLLEDQSKLVYFSFSTINIDKLTEVEFVFK